MKNNIDTIFGKKGSGKTEVCKYLYFSNPKPAIVIDIAEQFDDVGLNFPNVASLKEYLQKEWKSFYKKKQMLVLDEYNAEDIEDLLNFLWECKFTNFQLIIDEVDTIYNNHNQQRSKLRPFIHRGRHRQIDLITTSRRPANVGRDLTSQSDNIYIFRNNEPNDIKYFQNFIRKEAIAEIRNLDKYYFLNYSTENNSYDIDTLPKLV